MIKNKSTLVEMFVTKVKRAKVIRLGVNENHSKYMLNIVKENIITKPTIEMFNYDFKWMSKFYYLDSMLNFKM